MLGSSCSTYTGSSSAGNASRHDSRVRYQQNNTFSGHILPNYAASLKYAFSAENSAGIIRQTLVGTVLGIFLGGMLVGIIALVLFRRIRPVHQATKPSSDIEPSGVEVEDRTSSDTSTSTGKGRAGIRYIDSLGGSEQKDAPDFPPIKQGYLDNNAVMATKSAPLTDNPAYGSLPAIPVYEAPSQDAFLPAKKTKVKQRTEKFMTLNLLLI